MVAFGEERVRISLELVAGYAAARKFPLDAPTAPTSALLSVDEGERVARIVDEAALDRLCDAGLGELGQKAKARKLPASLGPRKVAALEGSEKLVAARSALAGGYLGEEIVLFNRYGLISRTAPFSRVAKRSAFGLRCPMPNEVRSGKRTS